jgi:hypothetical protein
MRPTFRLLSKVMMIGLFIGASAFAQQAATVIESNPDQLMIQRMDLPMTQEFPFLKWVSDRIEVPADQTVAIFEGMVTESVQSFRLNGREYEVHPKEVFTLNVPYRGGRTVFQIEVADQNGKMYRSQYRLKRVRDSTMTVTHILGDDPNSEFSRFRFSLGSGITWISYRQQDTTTFDEKVLTLKGGVVYRAIDSKLDLGISSFWNALILSNNSPQNDEVRYFGANFRATYHVIDAPSKVRFYLSGGLYWNSSGGNVGFADMLGPQIYPELTFLLGNGHSIYLYSKLAVSVTSNRGHRINENREVAAGAHYSFPLNESNRMSLGVDLSQLNLTTNDAWASTNTYSLSVGLSF